MLKNASLWVIIGTIFFLTARPSYSSMTNDEIIKKLEELSRIIKMQQVEIEELKKELGRQRKALDNKDDQAKQVKEEGEKAEERWHDQIPEWVKRINVSGDLRLRYEGRFSRGEKQTDESVKDLPDRHLYRFRARLFFDGKITDDLSAHFMLCTNQDENREATTTNQSFNDDFSDKRIYIHRAYATYKPNWIKGLELTAGKFKNTFIHTDIMWDPDVNPEGIYERYQYEGWNGLSPFVHFGQMVLNEENLETDDAALFIYQAGFNWKIGPVIWTLAGSYYNWSNLQSTEFLHTASYKGGGGNTFVLDENGVLQYLYDYELWEAVSLISFDLGFIPVTLVFNYIVNAAEGVPRDYDTAFLAGFKLGKEKTRGDWSLSYKYAKIENDAVIGSLNDQDFYGANRKGHKITLTYMLFDRFMLGASYFHTKPVNGWDVESITFDRNNTRQDEDRLQGEFLFKF